MLSRQIMKSSTNYTKKKSNTKIKNKNKVLINLGMK
jgi:hypothetical protein